LPYLLDALASPEVSTRLVAVSALAELDAPEVVPALARVVDSDADPNVRSAALTVLSIRPGAAASEALAALHGEELEERIVSALATPVEGRVEGLLAALQEAGDERARRAALALARLARPDAEAALVQALVVAPPVARRAAAQALAGLGSPHVREALFAASTGDPDAGVRSAAALALEVP
jgi:HEAT repeat protein